jgi:hypothetical protein
MAAPIWAALPMRASFTRDTLVWTPGQDGWKPADEVNEAGAAVHHRAAAAPAAAQAGAKARACRRPPQNSAIPARIAAPASNSRRGSSLVCPYCGHVSRSAPVPPAPPQGQREDGPWGESAILRDPATGGRCNGMRPQGPRCANCRWPRGCASTSDSDLTETVRTLSCPNCGAKVEITSDRHASTCPFCATPVVTDTGTTRLIKPQGVLPSSSPRTQAKRRAGGLAGQPVVRALGPDGLCPRGKQMSGVYSPFWTFDADTASRYSGARGDWYYETVYVTAKSTAASSASPNRSAAPAGPMSRARSRAISTMCWCWPRARCRAALPMR